jgi:hypothetical protein
MMNGGGCKGASENEEQRKNGERLLIRDKKKERSFAGYGGSLDRQ